MFIFLLNSSDFVKQRYGQQFYKPIISVFQSSNKIQEIEATGETTLKNNLYFDLYRSGFEVFKNISNFLELEIKIIE